MAFVKVTENFTCAHCGQKVRGSGPNCLYSKHVDELTPGDRAADCGGLMPPIGLQIKSGKPIIFHQCDKCSKITRNKTAPNDNQEELTKLSQVPLKRV